MKHVYKKCPWLWAAATAEYMLLEREEYISCEISAII